MMRTHGGAWTVVLVLGASVALGTVPDARAELDYEFAKGLLDWQDNNNFHSTDLVERLIAKLAKSPNKDQQLEAKLILAKLKRRQAESASAEKRNALLTEADNLYKEFLKDGAKHRLAKECDAEQATIQKDYALALIKAAQENPALNKENRAKAVDIYKKIADLMEADKAQFREPLKRRWPTSTSGRTITRTPRTCLRTSSRRPRRRSRASSSATRSMSSPAWSRSRRIRKARSRRWRRAR